MGKKKNPQLDWGDVGKDFAGMSVGALVSTRMQSMADDQLRKMDISQQTRGFMKVALVGGGGIIATHYLKNMKDLKEWPVEPFMYTAIGTTLKDGFDDIRDGRTESAGGGTTNDTAQGRHRRHRHQNGTFLEEMGRSRHHRRRRRGMDGTLATPKEMGHYTDGMNPYDHDFMAASAHYRTLTAR